MILDFKKDKLRLQKIYVSKGHKKTTIASFLKEHSKKRSRAYSQEEAESYIKVLGNNSIIIFQNRNPFPHFLIQMYSFCPVSGTSPLYKSCQSNCQINTFCFLLQSVFQNGTLASFYSTPSLCFPNGMAYTQALIIPHSL